MLSRRGTAPGDECFGPPGCLRSGDRLGDEALVPPASRLKSRALASPSRNQGPWRSYQRIGAWMKRVHRRPREWGFCTSKH
jgi:hypothetical protein